MTIIIFSVALIACFASYALHTYTHYLEYKGITVPQIIDQYFHKIVHAGYYAWILMVIFDPIKLNISLFTRIIGLVIGALGLYLFLDSRRKRKTSNKGTLITTGVYSLFRHPMYVGMTLMAIFIPICTGSIITLMSAILWISQMMIWTYWEEKELIGSFGQSYLKYKEKTRGWIR